MVDGGAVALVDGVPGAAGLGAAVLGPEVQRRRLRGRGRRCRGRLRIGLCPYSTADEVERVIAAVAALTV